MNSKLVLPSLATVTFKGDHKVRKELLKWLKDNKLPKASKFDEEDAVWRIDGYNIYLYEDDKFFISDREVLASSVHYGFRSSITYKKILKILKKSRDESFL